jgi:hypothetical protein
MSPSLTGPGSWTLASTPAGRETGGERNPALTPRPEFWPKRFNRPGRLGAAGGKLKGLKRATLIEKAEGRLGQQKIAENQKSS